MKKTILTILLFSYCFFSNAQKELWGNNKIQSYIDYSNPANPVTVPYFGDIIKYDINGENQSIVYVFDGINGKLPTGKLFLASNGKLYGMTSIYSSSTGQYDDAYLFEYDLILNKFRNVHTLDHTSYYTQDMFGVIEGLSGKLYGAIGNSFFCYDFNTETATTHVLTNYNADLTGELMKASDGYLYGTIFEQTPCPNINSVGAYKGSIIKINPINNTSELKYIFNCGGQDGSYPTGNLIEASPGVLYSTALVGGNLFYNSGSLFEYNFITNTFTKKLNFDDGSIGAYPASMANGNNGKLYGVCTFGGSVVTPPNQFFNFPGSIFEYTPATNTIGQLNAVTNHARSIMRASTGIFFGSSEGGVFRFNPVDNSLIVPCFTCTSNSTYPYVGGVVESLIEICRKPSYQEFVINTYAPAVGSTFTYNINNTNAPTYVWKKGTTILPAQTTGTLTLTNVTTNDTGVYTCTITNECGTTVTANLNINVTNLAVETVDDYKNQISLYPNPTKGIINLKFPENRGLKGLKYKITNLIGQVVIENDISTSNKNELAIDTSSFANGVYQVTLVTDKGNWNGKFVRE